MSDDAQIVVFASQKGGSGKTTLSGHLAVQAEQSGAGPVALIDTDPQGSLAKWWNARHSETPAFAQVSVPDLQKDVATLRSSGFRLIVIDTPPAVTSAIAEVIMHADLVVLPTRPSPHDLRAVGPTVDIVEYQRKPLVFVVNGATARARITGETAVALSQHGTVAPITLHQRVDFAASMIDGRTVGEVNANSRSAQEVADLWKYLADRLLRLKNGSRLAIHDPLQTYEDGVLTPMSDAEIAPEHTIANIVQSAAACTVNTSEPAVRSEPFEARPETSQPVSAQNANSFEELRSNPVPESPHTTANGTNGGWDGVDRRKFDSGPPQGNHERRKAFGRRESV
ncbi:MAG: AAA family ATPase [Methyloligellaceae bacterium]